MLLLSVSCLSRKSQNDMFAYADNLLRKNPQQALTYLTKKSTILKSQDSALFYLDFADAKNKTFQKMPSSSSLEILKDRFKQRKDAPNLLRAWYLLGCSYQEEGESPKAIECFEEATTIVDTTKLDGVTIDLLARIYGQMFEVYYSQVLPKEMMWAIDQSEKYYRMLNDTLAIAMSWENRGEAYDYLQLQDSAMLSYQKALAIYHKMKNDTAMAFCNCHLVHLYLKSGDTKSAKKCMEFFETKSNLFDSAGNIAKGYEIYYYDKGQYYLSSLQPDSAGYYFRKTLGAKNDDNCREAGFKGLYLLYRQSGDKDSIAKYADLAYRMNDKRILKLSSERVQRMQMLYNYSRNQKKAQEAIQKSQHKQKMLLLSIMMIILLFAVIVCVLIKNKTHRRNMLKKYKLKLRDVAYVKEQKILLEKKEFSKVIEANQLKIAQLTEEINKYQKEQEYSAKQILDESLQATVICQKFHEAGAGYKNVSDEDWALLKVMLYEKLPDFKNLMEIKHYVLSFDEFQICLLTRLSFKPSEISNILNMKSSTVSMKRERLHSKLFNENGKAREFDEKLLSFS